MKLRKFYLANYHHGNLRLTLIQTGLDLIAEHGAPALTLRELGKRAGVSRTAAYRHFRDRAALLEAIQEAGFERFADALEQARLAAGDNFTARMRALAVAYVRFAREYPAYFEVMFSRTGEPEASRRSEPGERAFETLHQTIRDGQATGDVRAGDSLFFACAAWAIVHGIAMLQLERFFTANMNPDVFIEACSGVILTGLKSL